VQLYYNENELELYKLEHGLDLDTSYTGINKRLKVLAKGVTQACVGNVGNSCLLEFYLSSAVS